MKVREVLRRLQDEGWSVVRQQGSHRILRHPTKPGVVVLAGNLGQDLARGTLNSVWKQAGLK